MFLIETDLERFSEADLQPMLDALPPSWQARILRKKLIKKRIQSAIAYTLLHKILQEQFCITDLPEIHTDRYGKPYFENSALHFSISHCNAAVACIVEKHPVGIDVQEILTDISPALAARIAAPLDPSTLTPQELTALWTQKEASAKLDGRGLCLPLEDLPIPGHSWKTDINEQYCLSVVK